MRSIDQILAKLQRKYDLQRRCKEYAERHTYRARNSWLGHPRARNRKNWKIHVLDYRGTDRWKVRFERRRRVRGWMIEQPFAGGSPATLSFYQNGYWSTVSDTESRFALWNWLQPSRHFYDNPAYEIKLREIMTRRDNRGRAGMYWDDCWTDIDGEFHVRTLPTISPREVEAIGNQEADLQRSVLKMINHGSPNPTILGL